MTPPKGRIFASFPKIKRRLRFGSVFLAPSLAAALAAAVLAPLRFAVALRSASALAFLSFSAAAFLLSFIFLSANGTAAPAAAVPPTFKAPDRVSALCSFFSFFFNAVFLPLAIREPPGALGSFLIIVPGVPLPTSLAVPWVFTVLLPAAPICLSTPVAHSSPSFASSRRPFTNKLNVTFAAAMKLLLSNTRVWLGRIPLQPRQNED